jgi:hypothetical protein
MPCFPIAVGTALTSICVRLELGGCCRLWGLAVPIVACGCDGSPGVAPVGGLSKAGGCFVSSGQRPGC